MTVRQPVVAKAADVPETARRLEPHAISLLFPAMGAAERQGLRDSLARDGLLDPILLFDGKILDGRHRYDACVELGIEPRFEEFDGDEPAARDHAVARNLLRRHLTAGQKALLGARLLPESQERARRRMAEGGRHGGLAAGDRDEGWASGPTPCRARDDVAAVVQVSGRSIERARRLQAEAPDLAGRVWLGELDLAPAERMLKQRRRLDQARQLAESPLAFPDGKYDVVAVDPPWRYDKRASDPTQRGQVDYASMTIEDICKLPVPDLAKADCVLWLWSTSAHLLVDAPEVLRAWGFEPKTVLIWDKEAIGCGDWLRGQTEPCVLATRGSPVVDLKGQSTLIRERRREHSRKPEAFYTLVEELCLGRKLELFARERRAGWDAWGAEIDRFTVAEEGA